MKPIDFLHNALESISKKFPTVHIKYAYNSIIHTHVVELLPLSEYKYNSALDEAWIPLSFHFRDSFPKEEIAFISSDSDLRIENSVFEFNVPCFEDMINEVFASLSGQEMHYSFPTSIPNTTILKMDGIVTLLKCPTKNYSEGEAEFDEYYYAIAA